MGIEKKAAELAQVIQQQEHVDIITHCDADGITGAAIAKQALDRAGIQNEVRVVRYLNKQVLEETRSFAWLIDLGNGNIRDIKKGQTVITDHHFSNEYYEYSLNPFYFGVDGETQVSGAGLAHMVASHIADIDATLAIIGAIGDLQDVQHRRLVGLNRVLLRNSRIDAKKDLRMYGRNQPLFRMIAYASDPAIPGLFKRDRSAIGFLTHLGIDYKKSWVECTQEERKTLFSALVKILLERGFGYHHAERLFGEVYEMDGEDIRNHATLLNSIGKYGEGESAVAMCIEEKFDGEAIRRKHRNRIRKYIAYAKSRLDGYGELYYFHGGTYIIDTVVGTIAGMLLRDEDFAGPLLAFAENDEGIKVSARAPYPLVQKGLNLSLAMKHTAQMLGGDGGGHRAAAGALIPKGMEEQFLHMFDAEIKNQLTR